MGPVAGSFNSTREGWCTRRTIVRADIEVWQHSLEQSRYARSDGMAVIQHDVCMLGTQPGDRPGNRRMVWLKKGAAAQGDLGSVGQKPRFVQRFPIKSRRRTQLGGGLTGIQRSAGWIPVAIDDRARDSGTDHRRTQRISK